MIINVLGTDYSVAVCCETEEKRLTGCDGFCDETTKKIYVENYADCSEDCGSKRNLDIQIKKNIRHELVHAFLFECGLAENSDWAQKEELVDWIAIQGPKIIRAWQEAEAL